MIIGIVAGAVIGGSIDASSSTDGIATAFKKKYSIVNNAEAINELAAMIKAKFHTAAVASPTAKTAMVRLTKQKLLRHFLALRLVLRNFSKLLQT